MSNHQTAGLDAAALRTLCANALRVLSIDAVQADPRVIDALLYAPDRGVAAATHVVVDGHTVLGKGNEIFPFAAQSLCDDVGTLQQKTGGNGI